MILPPLFSSNIPGARGLALAPDNRITHRGQK